MDKSFPARDYVATLYILNAARDRILLIHHNKLQKWLPPGGHMDPGELPHLGALREAEEEIGVRPQLMTLALDFFAPLTPKDELLASETLCYPAPLSVLVEKIPDQSVLGHHLHIDFLFAGQLDESYDDVAKFTAAQREISGLQWVSREELDALDSFKNVRAFAAHILNHAKDFRPYLSAQKQAA